MARLLKVSAALWGVVIPNVVDLESPNFVSDVRFLLDVGEMFCPLAVLALKTVTRMAMARKENYVVEITCSWGGLHRIGRQMCVNADWPGVASRNAGLFFGAAVAEGNVPAAEWWLNRRDCNVSPLGNMLRACLAGQFAAADWIVLRFGLLRRPANDYWDTADVSIPTCPYLRLDANLGKYPRKWRLKMVLLEYVDFALCSAKDPRAADWLVDTFGISKASLRDFFGTKFRHIEKLGSAAAARWVHRRCGFTQDDVTERGYSSIISLGIKCATSSDEETAKSAQEFLKFVEELCPPPYPIPEDDPRTELLFVAPEKSAIQMAMDEQDVQEEMLY